MRELGFSLTLILPGEYGSVNTQVLAYSCINALMPGGNKKVTYT